MPQVLLMTLERLRDGRLREPERIAFFVLGMCRLVVLEIRRGSWRRETCLAAYDETAEAVEGPESPVLDTDKLAACLETLAGRERTVVVLTFFADKSGDEVARRAGAWEETFHEKREGMLIREYRLAPGERVTCTIRADDDAVVSRLQVALESVKHVDAPHSLDVGDGHLQQSRVEDLSFDPSTGEVLALRSAEALRKFRLTSSASGSSRRTSRAIGRSANTFVHTHS